MRKALLDVGAAVAGGLATYAVTVATSSFGPGGRLVVSTVGALAALAVAIWAGRSSSGRAGSAHRGDSADRCLDVGTGVTGREGVRIEGVTAPAGLRRIRIGARARSKRTIVIKDIRVEAERDRR